MYSMLTVNEAIALVLKRISPLASEEVPIIEAHERVLTGNVRANRTVPPFTNSAMDGFAVRWNDVAEASSSHPAVLRIVDEVAAGYVSSRRVQPGTAIRIMTGACVPQGADTIIRVEYTKTRDNEVRVERNDGRASHVRLAGEDIKKGQVILDKGKVLSSADIGLMASVGKSRVQVFRRPVVGILSTGDELIRVEDPPRPGKIVNSNSYTLSCAVRETGAIARSLGIVRDRRKNMAASFRRALSCDVVMTSGGVSVGDYDFVKEALGDVGVKMGFWKVAQRPGHPMAFGRIGKKPVFGLPGNPVSSLVSFYLYARPALLKMMGHQRLFLPVVRATVEHDMKTAPGLKEFIRCQLRVEKGAFFASSTGTQSSGVLRSLSLAQGLVVAREDQSLLKKGSQAPVLLLKHQDLALQAEPGF